MSEGRNENLIRLAEEAAEWSQRVEQIAISTQAAAQHAEEAKVLALKLSQWSQRAKSNADDLLAIVEGDAT